MLIIDFWGSSSSLQHSLKSSRTVKLVFTSWYGHLIIIMLLLPFHKLQPFSKQQSDLLTQPSNCNSKSPLSLIRMSQKLLNAHGSMNKLPKPSEEISRPTNKWLLSIPSPDPRGGSPIPLLVIETPQLFRGAMLEVILGQHIPHPSSPFQLLQGFPDGIQLWLGQWRGRFWLMWKASLSFYLVRDSGRGSFPMALMPLFRRHYICSRQVLLDD